MQHHPPSQIAQLHSLARLIRYHSVNVTSAAHSGHLTSALSAADLMTGLVFGGTFRVKVDEPDHPNNDRLIFGCQPNPASMDSPLHPPSLNGHQRGEVIRIRTCCTTRP
jgi:hypothetical protein